MRSMYAAKGRCFGAIMTVQDGTVCMVLIIIVTAQSYSRCTHARTSLYCTILYYCTGATGATGAYWTCATQPQEFARFARFALLANDTMQHTAQHGTARHCIAQHSSAL